MAQKPNYEELEQRVKELEEENTELKRVEDALQESKEKRRSILENIEDGYFEVDIAGNFTFFNDSTVKIIGYPRDELIGMNNLQYTDEENAKKLYQTFNKVYATGKTHKGFDWEIIRKDGSKRHVEASVSLRKDSEGQPIGFRGIVRDVTDRKQAEEALRKSEERLKRHLETIDSMGMGIFIVDRDYHIRHMNKTMIKWFGDQTGLNCHQSIAGLDSPCAYCQIKSVINSGKTINYNPTIPNGRSFDITCSPVRNSDGSISKMEIIRDITKHKLAEEALRQSEERFRKLFEKVPAPIQGYAPDGTIHYWNKASENTYGYKKDEAIGKNIIELIIPPEMRDFVRGVIKQGVET